MCEVWIRPNQRAWLFGFIFPAFLLACGLGVMAAGWLASWHTLACVVGTFLLFLAAFAGIVLVYLLRQPRVAYENGEVLLYLQTAEPLRVPIENVECFFRGQGDGLLRGADGRDSEVATVIIRIAEAAQEWHHREVKPAFGLWCEGYITIRGTWCEPITPELLKRLNQRLVEVHRSQKERLQEVKT